MPTRADAINAVKTLQDLSDTEQKWLTAFVADPGSFSWEEILSHAKVINNLIGAQAALNNILTSQMVLFDEKLDEILETLKES